LPICWMFVGSRRITGTFAPEASSSKHQTPGKL